MSADQGAGGQAVQPASGRRRVAPGITHLLVALAALAVIAPLALSAAQAAPPAIAEFSPQVQLIKNAPNQQPGSEGGLGGGFPTPTPTPTPTPPAGASPTPAFSSKGTYLPCVGNPPRQTEDPQSPPCVAFWNGTDNGGATAFGVTPTTINVAIPQFAFGDPTADAALVAFFNKRYEFYGRQIKPFYYMPKGNLNEAPTPSDEDADAQNVKDNNNFASTGTGFRQGAEFLYYDDLAKRGIIGVSPGVSSKWTTDHLPANAPYEWSFEPPMDLTLRNWGEFICKALVNKTPAYAGGAQQQAATRSFGELIERPANGAIPDDSILLSALSNCGAGSIQQYRFEIDNSNASNEGRTALVNMQQHGVTSVVCICFFSDLNGAFMQDASSQGYQPEWVVQSYSGNDLEDSQGSATPDQKLHELGVSFLNKSQPMADAPWYWAVHDGNSSYAPPASDGYGETSLYQTLLIIASGIQAAGPKLTPQTFAAALQALQYPNPGCGRAPYYQACVGFGGGYTMVSSGTMIWHDPRQQGTVDSSRTAVCYVNHGTRYQLGQWPTDAQFYTSTCR